jgi:hypothetical protein
MRRSLVVIPLLLAACGPSTHEGDDDSGVDAHVAPDAHVGPDGTPFEQSLVYGHSGTELYRIDTTNLDTVDVGPFGAALGPASMTDIAVDKDGNMIGVSLSKIFSVDPDTGAATYLADFQGTGNLTSLSFVPLDPTDPQSAERLVTAGDNGDVYEVDPLTGNTTLLGNYGMNGADQIVSSGDIVSVRGAGTFATVDATANFTDPDYLAVIDPTDYHATLVGTVSTGADRIFGLAYWGGTLFGFVDKGSGNGGQLVTIDPTSGVATPATNQSFRWYGAGVTTIAPIVQ